MLGTRKRALRKTQNGGGGGGGCLLNEILLKKYPILGEIETYCKTNAADATMPRRHEVMRIAKMELEKVALSADEHSYVVGILKSVVFDGCEDRYTPRKVKRGGQTLFE
jgi:hypothetical protein